MIDVPGIVNQLMAVEQKPVTLIDNRLQTSNLKISALASFQSKLSSFQDALDALQTPANFSRRSVSVSQSQVVSVTVNSGTAPHAGRLSLTVAQTATASLTNISGFNSANQAISDASAYSIQVGGTVYRPSASDNITSLDQLRDWVNNTAGLKDAVRALVVKQDSAHWVLSLQGLSTGVEHQVTVNGPVDTHPITVVQPAQDALFTLNGIQFTRSTNTVSDVVEGLTLQLLSASNTPTTLDIAHDNSGVSGHIQAFVTSYNSLLAEFKNNTKASLDAAQRGPLNSDLTLSTIMRQISERLMKPLTSLSGSSLGSISDLSSLGIEFNNDGSMSFNQKLFDASPQLPDILANGISLGHVSGNDTLSTTLTNILSSSGSLADRIDAEKTTQSDLNKRKTQLQDKLAALQERYTAQYASLDALLFKLNNTNNALKSALDGLTNSQKNN